MYSISNYSTVFNHNCTDNVGILYHRHQQQLVTSGSEMNGIQRQLVIRLSLVIVLLCLELSLISNVYVVVVLYSWTAHSKCDLVLPALHNPFSLLQYSALRVICLLPDKQTTTYHVYSP